MNTNEFQQQTKQFIDKVSDSAIKNLLMSEYFPTPLRGKEEFVNKHLLIFKESIGSLMEIIEKGFKSFFELDKKKKVPLIYKKFLWSGDRILDLGQTGGDIKAGLDELKNTVGEEYVLNAFSITSEEYETLLSLAEAVLDQDNFEKAYYMYATISVLVPDKVGGLAGLIHSTHMYKGTQEAKVVAENLIKIFPEPLLHYMLANLYYSDGELAEADEKANVALELAIEQNDLQVISFVQKLLKQIRDSRF